MSISTRRILTWEQLLDVVPSEHEISTDLSRIDRMGLLSLLSRICVHLFVDNIQRSSDLTVSLQEFLACNLLSDELIARAQERFGAERLDELRPFHLQQTLTLFQMGVLAAARDGGLHPDRDASALLSIGTCLLKASDLLHSPQMRIATDLMLSGPTQDSILDVLLQAWSGLEVNNPPQIVNSVVRSDVIFRELLWKDQKWSSVAIWFERQTGLKLETYLDMNLAVLSYFAIQQPSDLIKDATLFALDPKAFFGVAASEDGAKYWEMEATSIEGLETRLSKELLGKSIHDFTELRVRPFLTMNQSAVLCINPGFVQEKLESGLFWAIANQLSNEERRQLFEIWGQLFEEYVAWFMHSCINPSRERLLRAPKYSAKKIRHESFDLMLISGSICVLFECKGGFLGRDAKYAENRDVLIGALDKKFGIEEGAAIEQLVRKIGQIFGADTKGRRAVEGVDVTGISQIIPAVVVQDRCASSELTGPWYADRFRNGMSKSGAELSVSCSGVVIVGIEELENLCAAVSAGATTFTECFLRRARMGDPGLGRGVFSFSDAVRAVFTERGIEPSNEGELQERFKSIIHRVSQKFATKPDEEYI